jgi:4-diphosphocytidyl-2-C-methyl-D-erythritol kinase
LKKVRLKAFAKVNYALEVRRVRTDGYHEISTIMQSISLADEVKIKCIEEGFEFIVEPEDAHIGPPEENTVYRAWKLLGEVAGLRLPVRLHLRKEVPLGAGLGGGSADAAAALVGLNQLFGLGLSDAELRGVGLRVGADVPFCVSGGTAVGEGIGEVLSPLPPPPPHHLVVAKPVGGVRTAEIYRAYDEQSRAGSTFVAQSTKALRMGDLAALAKGLGNDLAPVTKGLVPEVRALEEELLLAGAIGVAMTGTGTAVFGIFGSEEEAHAAERMLRAHFAAACGPVSYGVMML